MANQQEEAQKPIKAAVGEPQKDRTNVEPGVYKAKLIKMEEGESKKGSHQLTFTWKLLDAPQGKWDTVKSWAPFKENLVRIGSPLHKVLTALYGKELPKDYPFDDLSKFIGKECEVYIEHSAPTNGGVIYANVSKVLLSRQKEATPVATPPPATQAEVKTGTPSPAAKKEDFEF
jgi:hypothetical protein